MRLFAIGVLLLFFSLYGFSDRDPKTNTSNKDGVHALAKGQRAVGNGSDDDLDNLACSEISRVIRENGNELPTSLKGFVEYFNQHQGGVRRAPVVASQATRPSSLQYPRVLITPNERRNRLFMAFDFAKGERNLEFISWNQKKKEYDFGVIEHYDDPKRRNIISNPELRKDCIKCHKFESPHLQIGDWENMLAEPDGIRLFIQRQAEVDPDNYRVLWNHMQSLGPASKSYSELHSELHSLIDAKIHIDGEDTGLLIFPEGEYPGIVGSGLASHRDDSITDTGVYDNRVRVAGSHNLFHQTFKQLTLAQKQNYLKFASQLLTSDLMGGNSRDSLLGERNFLKSIIIDKAKQLPLYNKSTILDGFLNFQVVNQDLSIVNRTGLHMLELDKKMRRGEPIFKYPVSSDQAFVSENHEEDLAKWFGEYFRRRDDDDPKEDLNGTLDVLFGTTSEDKNQIDFLLSKVSPSYREEIVKKVVSSQALSDFALKSGDIPDRKSYVTMLRDSIKNELRKKHMQIPSSSTSVDYETRLSQDDPCNKIHLSKYPNRIQVGEPKTKNDHATSRCFSCHDNKPGIPVFRFDVGSGTAWKTWLTNADLEKRHYASQLATKVMGRLNNPDSPMPPTDAPQLSQAEKDALIKTILYPKREDFPPSKEEKKTDPSKITTTPTDSLKEQFDRIEELLRR